MKLENMSDEVTPDLQPTATKRRSRNKLWLFLGVALILIIGIAITPDILRKIEKNRDVKCKDNLKQLYCALKQYAMDFDDHFPDSDNIEGLGKLHGDYMKGYSLCCCPSANTGIIHDKLSDKNISYVYFGGFMEMSSIWWPNIQYSPMLFDRPGNHKDHINYIYDYGNVETLNTKAKTCSEFIEDMNRKIKYHPILLKKLREKAAEADRRYSQEK